MSVIDPCYIYKNRQVKYGNFQLKPPGQRIARYGPPKLVRNSVITYGRNELIDFILAKELMERPSVGGIDNFMRDTAFIPLSYTQLSMDSYFIRDLVDSLVGV